MTSLLTTIEREAIREGRPVLYAVLATALARWFGQPDTLGALMERAYLFTARERAVLARGIGQVRTIAELVGRAKMQANATGIEFAKPDEAAKRLNPKRAFKLRPRKAMSYFKALSPARRVPLSKEWLDDHRREAFTMAEVTEATILKRVHKLIFDAIEEGDVTTQDFQVKLKDLGVTSKNPQYAEMVFRTNALDSYNKGYYDEVREDPDLGEYFPYWEYLAVEDDRLSEEHGENLRGENGPYYPASRSFDSVRGDRVFNCRCTFRWVDKYEAAELGLIEHPETGERVARPRIARAKAKPVAPAKISPAVAQKRIVSIDRAIKKLAVKPGWGNDPNYKKLKREKKALLAAAKQTSGQAFDAVQKKLQPSKAIRVTSETVGKGKPGDRARLEKSFASAAKKLKGVMDPSLFHGNMKIRLKIAGPMDLATGRSAYAKDGKTLKMLPWDKPKDIIHEVGHLLEDLHPKAHRASVDFFERRTRGKPVLPLGGPGGLMSKSEYGGRYAGEYGKDGGFFDPYVGKVYPGMRYTEVISMGMQEMMTRPDVFRKKDPGHFNLITDILGGKYS